MPISELHVQEFMDIFSGSKHSYGELIYGEQKEKGQKREGRYRHVTDKLITIENYRDHLNGGNGLGVIPVNENGTCKFAVIDVDIYDDELTMYVEAIERGGFPFVPFKSKSGGLHIYLFFKEETLAAKATELMRRYSFILAIDTLVKQRKNGTVEVFPKQTILSPDKKERGSFINLPYYNTDSTVQYAIRANAPLTFNDAIMYVKDKRTTLTEATTFLESLVFNDAPPCLQMIHILDPFERMSGRNNYLFSLGVYLKKKDEDFFEQTLQEVNANLRSPLKPEEVDDTILSSLRKKDYTYRCKDTPCVDFCHKKECRNREFGIGKNEGYFSSVECGQLFQYRTSQPYYEWEVRLQGQEEFKKLRFKTEDEIIKQDAFLRLCMRELYELPSKLKQIEWFNKVNAALKEIKCVSVEVDDDTSPLVILRSLIYEFLTTRAMAETKEQLLANRVYFDQPSVSYWFRTKDLVNFLFVTKQFKFYGPQEIHGVLKELKCDYKKISTESRKQVRVTSLSKKCLEESEQSPDVFHPDFSKYSQEEDF
jgi:hypothetical protein